MIDDELQRLLDIRYLIEERKSAGPQERDLWIRAARYLFSPGERGVCHVCGKFRSITHAHHVVPLTAQYDRGFEYPDQEFVWLCPNHHTMIHLVIPGDHQSMKPAAFKARGETTSALHEDLSEDEFNKLMALMRRSARSPQ